MYFHTRTLFFKSWKSGSNPIRSDYKTTLSDPIRSEMILPDPKSENIRSDRIRIRLVSDRICTSLVEFETSLHIFSIKDYMHIVLNNST